MLIFAVLIVLLGIGIILIMKYDEDSNQRIAGVMVSVTSVAIILITVLIIILNQYSGVDKIQQYNATKETIENSRIQEASDVERATITSRIIDTNKELASAKYWNGTIFDIFVNDGYAELEPLK